MWNIAWSVCLLVTAPGIPAAGAAPDTAARAPVSAEALSHYVAGRLLELSGSSQDAIAEFTRALSLDPAAFSVLLHLSEASARANETSQSLEFAERAVKMRPGDGKALWMKGAALFNMQRAPEALPVLQAACVADSDQAEYLRTLARVAETLDRTDIVERAYARSVVLEEEDGESWFQLAAAQARLGKFATADSSLARSLELNPIRPGAFFLRGWIRENEGKLDDAIGFYQHHLLVHTTDDGTRGRLVTLLARRRA